MRKLLAIAAVALALGTFGIWGCGTTGGGRPRASKTLDFTRLPKTPEMEAAFQKAEELYFARRIDEAQTAYQE